MCPKTFCIESLWQDKTQGKLLRWDLKSCEESTAQGEGAPAQGSWGSVEKSRISSWGCNGDGEMGGSQGAGCCGRWSSGRKSRKTRLWVSCVQETWLVLCQRQIVRGGRFGEEKATFKKNHGSSSKRTIYSCVCVCVCVCVCECVCVCLLCWSFSRNHLLNERTSIKTGRQLILATVEIWRRKGNLQKESWLK